MPSLKVLVGASIVAACACSAPAPSRESLPGPQGVTQVVAEASVDG